MFTRFGITLTLILATAVGAAAQPTVFVVRHAERADAAPTGNTMMMTDPDLSEAGRARAASLASMLRSAGITTVIATEFKRTQQTAEPLAKALGVKVIVMSSRESAKVAEAARQAAGNVLVVGHSNTVPEVLTHLGVTDPVTIADSDFDNLFLVMPGPQPRMVRLHFR
jgi:broad specificity phosphatase PhoE